jgi:hypothetical protein
MQNIQFQNREIMIYEIRNYHFDPEFFEEYKKWSREMAYPYAKNKLEIVGFCLKNDIPVEYSGSLPRDKNCVPSNVTCVIKWKDLEHRNKGWKEFRSDEWARITSLVPGDSKSYLREEAKFTEVL